MNWKRINNTVEQFYVMKRHYSSSPFKYRLFLVILASSLVSPRDCYYFECWAEPARLKRSVRVVERQGFLSQDQVARPANVASVGNITKRTNFMAKFSDLVTTSERVYLGL